MPCDDAEWARLGSHTAPRLATQACWKCAHATSGMAEHARPKFPAITARPAHSYRDRAPTRCGRSIPIAFALPYRCWYGNANAVMPAMPSILITRPTAPAPTSPTLMERAEVLTPAIRPRRLRPRGMHWAAHNLHARQIPPHLRICPWPIPSLLATPQHATASRACPKKTPETPNRSAHHGTVSIGASGRRGMAA